MRSDFRKEKRRSHKKRISVILIIVIAAAAVVCMYKAGIFDREPEISFSRDSITVNVGESEKLSVSYDPADKEKPDITWSSSDDSVASVKGGVVTAREKGSATIKAETEGGQKIKCKVTVKKPAKTVYLTFDDGPSSNITPKLLDLLKKEKVHATFFVVGFEVKEEPDLVKRAVREGNTVGIHTFTHDYNQIYASEGAFFADFNKTERLVKKVTGRQPSVCRMPGGSASGYCSVAMAKSIIAKMRERGYKCSDWSTSYGDTSLKDTTVKTLVHRVRSGIRGKKYPVILAHDSETKETSYRATAELIRYFKAKHYAFSTVDKYKGNPPLQVYWDPSK